MHFEVGFELQPSPAFEIDPDFGSQIDVQSFVTPYIELDMGKGERPWMGSEDLCIALMGLFWEVKQYSTVPILGYLVVAIVSSLLEDQFTSEIRVIPSCAYIRIPLYLSSNFEDWPGGKGRGSVVAGGHPMWRHPEL